MFNRILFAALSITLFWSAFAQESPKPEQSPTPLTDAQKVVARETSKLVLQGKTDEALDKYEKLFKESPSNDMIMYEMASLQNSRKNYTKCIELAARILQYKSTFRSKAYLLLGACYDQKGDVKKALETYSEGLAEFPKDSPLYLYQGMTLNAEGKLDEARSAAKRSVMLGPNNAGAHLLLASIYLQSGYRVPAMLAAFRFLVLEPGSKQSQVALQIVRKVLEGGTLKSEGKSNPSGVSANAKTDEGDFQMLEILLGSNGPQAAEVNKNKSDAQRMIEQLDFIFQTISPERVTNNDKDVSGFVYTFYVPYFVEMHRQKLVEPFMYVISASNKRSETEKWLTENQQTVNDFMNWSAAYKWPRS